MADIQRNEIPDEAFVHSTFQVLSRLRRRSPEIASWFATAEESFPGQEIAMEHLLAKEPLKTLKIELGDLRNLPLELEQAVTSAIDALHWQWPSEQRRVMYQMDADAAPVIRSHRKVRDPKVKEWEAAFAAIEVPLARNRILREGNAVRPIDLGIMTSYAARLPYEEALPYFRVAMEIAERQLPRDSEFANEIINFWQYQGRHASTSEERVSCITKALESLCAVTVTPMPDGIIPRSTGLPARYNRAQRFDASAIVEQLHGEWQATEGIEAAAKLSQLAVCAAMAARGTAPKLLHDVAVKFEFDERQQAAFSLASLAGTLVSSGTNLENAVPVQLYAVGEAIERSTSAYSSALHERAPSQLAREAWSIALRSWTDLSMRGETDSNRPELKSEVADLLAALYDSSLSWENPDEALERLGDLTSVLMTGNIVEPVAAVGIERHARLGDIDRALKLAEKFREIALRSYSPLELGENAAEALAVAVNTDAAYQNGQAQQALRCLLPDAYPAPRAYGSLESGLSPRVPWNIRQQIAGDVFRRALQLGDREQLAALARLATKDYQIGGEVTKAIGVLSAIASGNDEFARQIIDSERRPEPEPTSWNPNPAPIVNPVVHVLQASIGKRNLDEPDDRRLHWLAALRFGVGGISVAEKALSIAGVTPEFDLPASSSVIEIPRRGPDGDALGMVAAPSGDEPSSPGSAGVNEVSNDSLDAKPSKGSTSNIPSEKTKSSGTILGLRVRRLIETLGVRPARSSQGVTEASLDAPSNVPMDGSDGPTSRTQNTFPDDGICP